MSALTGRGRIAGVMGWPISHSKSPRLHGYWLREHGVDGAYVPLAVAPDRLGAALAGLRALGFRGGNVTAPHKEAVLAHLDQLDPFAVRVGAVNMITVEEDGTLSGRNTDGFGFLENLKQGAPGWSVCSGRAVLLGAGGAARAIVAALQDAGAPEIILVNRSVDKAARLAADLGGAISARPLADAAEAISEAHLLVNATSLGMTGQPPLELRLDTLPKQALVTDIVYAPLETGLLAAARMRGNPTVDGLGMLLHQGRPGFELWFGVAPSVTDGLRAQMLQR